MEELEVLDDITQRLCTAGIPYMLTGSMALSFYARPRMTRDIDIVIELHESDIHPLVNALGEDYYVDPEAISQALRYSSRMFNVIHEQFVIKVDLIIRHDSEYAQTAFKRRRIHAVSGQPVNIIAPEDLIIAKLDWAKASFSERQLDDIRALLLYDKLDRVYLVTWIQKLGLVDVWKVAQT